MTPRRAVWTALLALAGGCGGDAAAPRPLILASTTSVEDSGLLDVLVPAFQRANGENEVRVVAVGTGEALELGRRGDADVLLTHAPAAERAFVAAGHGESRREVLENDFVLLGPASDPAGIRGTTDAAAALASIAAARAPFVSRGDDSGTQVRERELWAAAGVFPAGDWYMDAGQGMGEVLRIASERGAYVLTDRGTYLFLRDGLRLEVMVEGDSRLVNRYAVVTVAGAGNARGARAFAEWLTSAEAARLIDAYGRERYGRPLFVPVRERGGGRGS